MLALNILLLAPDSKGVEATAESIALLRRPGGMSVNVIISAYAEDSAVKTAVKQIAKRFPVRLIEGGDSAEQCLANGIKALPSGALLVCRAASLYDKDALRLAYKQLRAGVRAVGFHPLTYKHTASRLVKILHNPYDEYMPKQPAGGAVDLNESPEYTHTALDAFVFCEELVGSTRLEANTSLHGDALHEFTLNLLAAAKGYYYLADCPCVIGTALENCPALYRAQHEEWWYTPSVVNMWQCYLDGEGCPRSVQYAVAHHVLSKALCNYDNRDKGVLGDKASVAEFFTECARALCGIDNDIIHRWCDIHRWTGLKESRNVGFHRALETALLREKARLMGGKLQISLRDGNIFMSTAGEGEFLFCRADNEYLDINIINYENGGFVIDAGLSAADFLEPDDVRLYAVYGGSRVRLEQYPLYPLISCFGVTAARKYLVHFELPADIGTSCGFEYEVGGVAIPLRLRFPEAFSRLVTDRNKSFWCFTKGRYLCCPDNRSLCVRSLGSAARIGKELRFTASMLNYKGARKLIVMGSIAMRCLYWLTKPFYGKSNRWITFDKLYKGGDNGEYFFRYAQTRSDGAKTYYIIDKTASEYKRLRKKYGSRVLKSVSPRCMLTALGSNVIVATHSTVLSYLGFPRPTQAFFRDLFDFKVACIQHGLTVQQLAQYQNRVFDNTTLYCLASPYEHKNLMKPIYGFEEKHLKMTGLARFDGLVNDDRKFILITPTWRRNVVNSGIAHIKKSHSDAFKGSEYYRLYNSLINDSRLIECARRCGYGITYLLHPAMSAQLDDFDKNDYVRILAAAGDTNYEQMLTQASLMVTDYSGVQFDFAYMRKPIVYYHPDTLPPQYESGSIDYPTTGFGEICTTHERLIDALCRFMEGGCVNTPLYIKRADDFFAFDDRRSCERIYDEVKKFAAEK